MNLSIFDVMYDNIKLTEPIRMFEAFSGIGTQAMALKQLGVDYEIVGFSEIDKYAIKSYHAIHGDIKNYGDITKMEKIPSCDIFTWSFPCTDLSKAGKQLGMKKDTRSGLVYEVLRLVRDTKDKPKVLIMENVPDLIQAKFVKQFNEIQLELEDYGYKNYVEILNAKDFGVAQNRKRVFMVSVLGDYNYNFPTPIPLTKRLKDYLEEDVDEKYFLSDKIIKTFSDMTNRNGYIRGEIFKPHDIDDKYAFTITTKAGSRPTDNYIKIPEDTKQGYALAADGDGVYINRPHQKRGVVQKGMIQTIKTSVDDIGVVVNDITLTKVNDSYSMLSGGKWDKLHDIGRRVYNDNGTSPTIHTMGGGNLEPKVLLNNLRIRKLTPKECWRLMGCSDDDFDKAQETNSNSQLYKQAGNAIVVDVFREILKGLL